MACEERARLEKEHAEAGDEFDAARQRLRARIGVCPKDEFHSLDRALKDAWVKLLQARIALDRHIRDHGCEKACSCSA